MKKNFRTLVVLLSIALTACCNDDIVEECEFKVISSYSIININEFGMIQSSLPIMLPERDTLAKCEFEGLVFYKVEETTFPNGAIRRKTTTNKLLAN